MRESKDPLTLQWGWWFSPNPSCCRKPNAHDVPSSAYTESWQLILGALSGAAELTVSTPLEVFRKFGRGLAFSALFLTGSGWSLLKTQLPQN